MTAQVPEWEDPRRVLARRGLVPKRSFSQSFLVSKSALEAIVRASGAGAGVRVVELGPGLGTLTAALLRAGASVIAIEKDRDMLALLREELPTAEVREGDAATVDLGAFGRVVLVGNLPYAITGAILRNVIAHRGSIERAVLMVQREVRDRWVAAPGTKAYGVSSVFVQAAFDVRTVVRVPAGSFHPKPRVDSAIVSLTPLPLPRAEETEPFRAVVHAAFGTRRKTLRNALRALGDVAQVERALLSAGIDGQRRGETLSIEELRSVAEAWTLPQPLPQAGGE